MHLKLHIGIFCKHVFFHVQDNGVRNWCQLRIIHFMHSLIKKHKKNVCILKSIPNVFKTHLSLLKMNLNDGEIKCYFAISH